MRDEPPAGPEPSALPKRQRPGSTPPARPLPPRDRLPPRVPPKPPMLHYAKPKDHPFVRWLRHRRDFVLEELTAYRRVGMAILVGIVFLAACLLLIMLRMPRTSSALFRLFSQ